MTEINMIFTAIFF